MKKIYFAAIISISCLFFSVAHAFEYLNIGSIDKIPIARYSVFLGTAAASTANDNAEEVKLGETQKGGREADEKKINGERVKERLSHARTLKLQSKDIIEFVDNISPSLGMFLRAKFLGTYVVLIIMALLVFVLGWLIQHFILAWAFSIASKQKEGSKVKIWKSTISKLQSPLRWIVIVISANIATAIVITNKPFLVFVGKVVDTFFVIMAFWALGILADTAYSFASNKMGIRFQASKHLFDLCRRLTKYLIITICILSILKGFGINVDAIIASLGIGGAALAFASKDTIANFFGSLSIIADRSFAVGDMVQAGGVEGTVESVGLRSTRIRTYSQTLVAIPNSVLANESIENLTRRSMRRASMTLGLTYATNADQMSEILEDLRKLLKDDIDVDKYGIRVNFLSFGDSALEINLIFYIKKVDIIEYSNVLERINLNIMRAVAKRNLSFAFPSRSLYIESLPSEAGSNKIISK